LNHNDEDYEEAESDDSTEQDTIHSKESSERSHSSHSSSSGSSAASSQHSISSSSKKRINDSNPPNNQKLSWKIENNIEINYDLVTFLIQKEFLYFRTQQYFIYDIRKLICF
jgi:hypothetical protein